MRRCKSWVSLGLILGWCLQAAGQDSAAWRVRPEWVKAHEAFLASDALRGRGSATRDEQIAATYVGSEFLSYGLQPAPGMDGFVQGAEVAAPELDGHAALEVKGAATLLEGADFALIVSPGAGTTGPLLRKQITAGGVSDIKGVSGAVVLLLGQADVRTTLGAVRALQRAGAQAVLVEGGPAMSSVLTSDGGKTSVPIGLKGTKPSRSRVNVLSLKAAAFSALSALPEGEAVHVVVNEMSRAEPRYTYNALGYLPGTDPSAGTLLLTAHLDHLGLGTPVNGDGIFNGANDDAAGTTAVLELAHALASGTRPRRSILFVCYGSEELGELGSTYFGAHPPVPLDKIIANLEFEMIGNQDPKMPKGTLLLTGWERSNLGPELKAHGALLGPDPYPEEHFFERSDNYALALKGVVAHTAAGWGTPPTYHQPSDDLAHLDLDFMTAAIQSLVEPVRWLASNDFVPRWNPNGRPH